MDHFSRLRKVLDEAIETPHEIIGHSVKAASLPVNQHGGEHIILSINLLQHEIVNLSVAVNQGLQFGQGFLLL